MQKSQLNSVYEANLDFLNHLLAASKFDDSSITAIPTVIFIFFMFIICHGVIHRRTNARTPLKIQICKEVILQWTYFYILRLWFMLIKFIKLAEDSMKELHRENRLLWISCVQMRAVLQSILIFISFLPLGIAIFTYFWKQNIPDFLMWVGEDPWLRSEIGISGHYLNRPFISTSCFKKEYAYRCRRSSSMEHITVKHVDRMVRNCKSLDIINCGSCNRF